MCPYNLPRCPKIQPYHMVFVSDSKGSIGECTLMPLLPPCPCLHAPDRNRQDTQAPQSTCASPLSITIYPHLPPSQPQPPFLASSPALPCPPLPTAALDAVRGGFVGRGNELQPKNTSYTLALELLDGEGLPLWCRQQLGAGCSVAALTGAAAGAGIGLVRAASGRAAGTGRGRSGDGSGGGRSGEVAWSLGERPDGCTW